MEIILVEDVPSLGKAGDRMRVSDGYARNYLLPRKMAVTATATSLKALEHERDFLQHKHDKLEQEARKLAQKIGEISCTIAKPTGEEGKLFGAVTSSDIEAALRDQGISVDRKKILLEEPIKNLGVYTVSLKLHPAVAAELKLWVVKE
jgi:large subunit ribosomal protein L9